MTLVDAWAQWVAGADIRSAQLWGIEILWWGRIGKLIQLVTAILGAIEIIGAAKVAAFLTTLLGTRFARPARGLNLLSLFALSTAASVLLNLLLFWLSRALQPRAPNVASLLMSSLPYVFPLVLAGLLWYVLLLRSLDFDYLMKRLFIRVAAAPFSERVHAFLKLLLLLIFLLGFHFDLLAS